MSIISAQQRPLRRTDGLDMLMQTEKADAGLRQFAQRCQSQYASLPAPGAGDTLGRWRHLAAIAAEDVCGIKLMEAHYDAQAILAELRGPAVTPSGLLAVWAAEPPDAKLAFEPDDAGGGTLHGTKAWCSGADLVDAALVTAHAGKAPVLVLADMSRQGISRVDDGWHAVGMGRLHSGRLAFDAVPALMVGVPGAYLERPGFWHGGAGIAACWFGAVVAIADTLRNSVRAAQNPHAMAHLGAIDMALAAAAALLRETAALIDAAPEAAHQREVTRVRSVLERICTDVIDRVGRALGPAPLCEDRAHALRCADLATFIRQSHAERDWAWLGQAVQAESTTWTL